MKYVAMIAILTAVFGLCADNIYLRNENQRSQVNQHGALDALALLVHYTLQCDDQKKECTAMPSYDNVPACPPGFVCKLNPIGAWPPKPKEGKS